jgi:hypothetical protein
MNQNSAGRMSKGIKIRRIQEVYIVFGVATGQRQEKIKKDAVYT